MVLHTNNRNVLIIWFIASSNSTQSTLWGVVVRSLCSKFNTLSNHVRTSILLNQIKSSSFLSISACFIAASFSLLDKLELFISSNSLSNSNSTLSCMFWSWISDFPTNSIALSNWFKDGFLYSLKTLASLLADRLSFLFGPSKKITSAATISLLTYFK